MLRVGIYELVLALRCAYAVVEYLLVGVDCREHPLFGLRSIVGAIIKTLAVTCPIHARELYPADVVRKELLGAGIHHTNLNPVRACCRQRVGEERAILGEGAAVQSHGAVCGEGVWVKEYLLLGVTEAALAVEYALILQAAVARDVVPLATLCRCALGRVVAYFVQSLTYRLTVTERAEVVEGYLILSLDPLCSTLAVVIFQPAVWVGNLYSEVVVHYRLTSGLWVVYLFVFHTLDNRSSAETGHITTCRYRHRQCYSNTLSHLGIYL